MTTMYYTSLRGDERLAQLWEDLRADPVPLCAAESPTGTEVRIPLRQAKPINRKWRVDLAVLFESALEPEVFEPPRPAASIERTESAVVPQPSLAAAHEESLALSCPFHWEPKPAWVNQPAAVAPALLNPADPRLFPAVPKIPIRPLHKQPFYRRFYFYLRRWLRKSK